MIRRARLGRLGCLGVILLVAGVLVALAPWSLRIGGRWTPMAWWGLGRVDGTNGERYALYVYLYPYFRGRVSTFRTRMPRNSLRGSASLCTAQGTIYKYKLSGGIFGAWLDTDGSDVSFYITDPRKQLKRSIELHGSWHGPELVMEDGGSLDRSFRPDGALKPKAAPWPTPGREQRAGVTLRSGSYSEFETMCRNEIARRAY